MFPYMETGRMQRASSGHYWGRIIALGACIWYVCPHFSAVLPCIGKRCLDRTPIQRVIPIFFFFFFRIRPSGLFLIRVNLELWMLWILQAVGNTFGQAMSLVAGLLPALDNTGRRNADRHPCL
jgi:hypothetical protein